MFLTVLFVPLTYLIISVFFEEHNSLEALGNRVTGIAALEFVLMIMYMVEIASRYQSSHHEKCQAQLAFSRSDLWKNRFI